MITITRENDDLTLPEEIQDVISYEQVNTREFMQDDNNVIFMIDDNFYGFQKYFLPLQDEFIVFDCGDEGFSSLLTKYNNGTLQHLVNLEKIGLKLPYDQNLGILVDMKEFLECFNAPGMKIAKIYRDNDLELITRITSKAFLLNPSRVGAVSSAHCQLGYLGCIFNIKALTDSYTIKGLYESDVIISKDIFNRCNEFSKCEDEDDYKLLLEACGRDDCYIDTTDENRERLKQLGFKNPFDLPKEYYEIYEEEKTFREYEGFSNLIEINENIVKENNIANIINRNDRSCGSGFSIKFESHEYDTERYLRFLFKDYGLVLIELYNSQEIDRIKQFINDNLFLEFLSNIPGVKEHVVIAGGYALSYASKKYLDKDITYVDIDLFLYDLDYDQAEQLCNLIINELYNIALVGLYGGEKTFKLSDNENCITVKVNGRIIQIVKRIYKSPSHIIHGFDIDCCCVLIELNNKKVFTTKRGYYSIKNQINVYNFDRLSNSYNYRIIKYLRTRGYNIYMPGLNKIIETVNTNFMSNDENLAFKFIKILLFYSEIKNKTSDYDDVKTIKNITPEEINYTFSTLNPNEQSNNTFHRIVMEDGYKFYPVPNDNLFDVSLVRNPELKNEYIRFNKTDFKPEIPEGYNVIIQPRKLKDFTDSDVFLDTIRKFNLALVGDFAIRCLLNKKYRYEGISFIMYNVKNYSSATSKAFEIIQHIWENHFMNIKRNFDVYEDFIETINLDYNKDKIIINTETTSNYKLLTINFDVDGYLNPREFRFYFDVDEEKNIDENYLIMYQDNTFSCNKLVYNRLKYFINESVNDYNQIIYFNNLGLSDILENRRDLLKYFHSYEFIIDHKEVLHYNRMYQQTSENEYIPQIVNQTGNQQYIDRRLPTFDRPSSRSISQQSQSSQPSQGPFFQLPQNIFIPQGPPVLQQGQIPIGLPPHPFISQREERILRSSLEINNNQDQEDEQDEDREFI